MKKSKRFILNVALLTGSTLALRAIGVAFNVFVSGKLGADGMGLFTLIMSVYGFAVTFATSGVGLACTRLTAEGIGAENDEAVRSAAKRSLIYGTGFGISGALILYAAAGIIGRNALGDARTIISLRALSVSLPFVSVSSALGGYFNAVRRVAKSVSAQLLTQGIRIAVTAFLFSFAFADGIEGACFAVSAGASVSETAACLYMVILYELDLRRHIKGSGEAAGGLTRRLLNIALPVAFSAYFRSGLITIEHILIPRGLGKYNERLNGGGGSGLATYGVLHGMVFPIVLFPMAFLSAFSGMLVPELAEERERGHDGHIDYIVSRVTGVSLIFAVAVAGYMAVFSQELGMVIYSNAEACVFIRVLAPLIPVMYLDHITDGMLKGLGEQLYSMRVNIVDSALSCLLVWIVLPYAGIKGYIVVLFICELLNSSLSIGRLLTIVRVRLSVIRRIILPLLCIAGATSVVRIAVNIAHITASAASLIFTGVMTAALYIVMLRATGAVSKSEIAYVADNIGIADIFAHLKNRKRDRGFSQPL